MKKLYLILSLLFSFVSLSSSAAYAAPSLPNGFSDTVVIPFGNRMNTAVHMTIAPDGRVFVGGQDGTIRIVKNGVLLPTAFAKVNAHDVNENGLHGLALDPNFTTNGYIYMYYVAKTPQIHGRISRLTADPENPDVALVGSEYTLLDMPNTSANLHNGGGLVFGTDGKLYVTLGEKGQPALSQNMNSFFGKIIRLNPDGTIPEDNPFYMTAQGQYRAIYALGLRNPYNITIQSGSGKIFFHDVGQGGPEEINELKPGKNYGWPILMGSSTNPLYENPFFSYWHNGPPPGGCAITGGSFYNPTSNQFPADYRGEYFWMDWCKGYIQRLDLTTKTRFDFLTADATRKPTHLEVDSDGSMYYLSRKQGAAELHKITFTSGGSAPTVSQQPLSTTVALNESVSFIVEATGSEPLHYQWQRDGINIPNATNATYTLPSSTLDDNGAVFRCIITNFKGTITSDEATLTVVNGSRPSVTIISPTVGSTYSGGDTINFEGTATDPDEVLTDAAFTWSIEFHHQNADGTDQHTHPGMLPLQGVSSGSFELTAVDETSIHVWKRVVLEVVDSTGLKATSYVDVRPNLSSFTIETNPSGLFAEVDGQAVQTPYTTTGVVGVVRNISAISPQNTGCTSYDFDSWSDLGTESHDISTPVEATIFTVTYTTGTQGSPGLCGNYFDAVDFSGISHIRVDPVIDFLWGDTPLTGINPDTFSVRWNGFIQPVASGTYTIYALSNDGVRIWINNQLVINDFVAHWDRERSGTITLEGGQRYPIRIEYFDNTAKALMKLSWSGLNLPKQVIPSSVLFTQ